MVLGDFNVQFTSRESSHEVVPGVVTAKWAALRQGMMEVGPQQAVPSVEQMRKYSHVPFAQAHSGKHTD